jgi:single-stranded-DNA-specific exonuclease
MIFKKRSEANFNIKQLKELAHKFHVSEPTMKLLFLRGINTEQKITEFFTPSFDKLNDPFLFTHMQAVVDKITLAVKQNKRIVIFGDYDVDGMSASSILYLYLKKQGANVNVFLPNRYEDEYGLTVGAIDKIIASNDPHLIITVDCGITAVEEVEYIKSKNIDVIITDHHEVPEVEPNCLIINPKRKEEAYPFKELCGSGVALKLVQAMGGQESITEYLDIAALATIADIVDLTDENRTIVQLGLQKLKTRTKEGLKLLFKELKLSEQELNSIDIAFKVAPKINASGRMGKAEVGFSLLVEKDKKKLAFIVKELLSLNTLRQELCQKVYENSLEKLKEVDLTKQNIIILSDKNWDAGLLGIVAARIADEFNKPTILFSEVDGKMKGSARSIDGIDIHKAINCLTVELEAFGGHTMAAGLTVKQALYEQFKHELQQCMQTLFDASYFDPVKYYDLDLSVKDATVSFAKELNYLAPFGHSNAQPLFQMTFQNAKVFPMKNFPEHLSIYFHKLFNIIHFNGDDYLLNYAYFKKKHTLLEIQLNTFRGKQTVRGIVKALRFSELKLKEVSSFVKANHLMQLSAQNTLEAANYKKIASSGEVQLIKELTQKNEMGVLVVCNNVKTYQSLENELFQNTPFDVYLFQINDKVGLNSMVFGLNSFKNLNSFKHIVFLENVLSEEYIKQLNKHTSATIYTPQVGYQKRQFHFSTNREVFGTYFNAIKQAIKQKVQSHNLYFYFEAVKKQNKQISNFNFVQFYACLEVFCELNIIEVVQNKGVYYLKLNKNIKSNLEHSRFYNKLK